MKRNVTEYDFTQAFTDYGRSENFSYEGRKALYDWFIELEEGCGEEIEFDVIGICCEFSEYESALECITDCGYDCDLDGVEEEDKETAAMEYLLDQTSVIEHEKGIIIAQF